MEPQAPQVPQEVQSSTPPPVDQPVNATPTSSQPTPTQATNPGHGMGIVGLVLAFIVPLVGLILSIVAVGKSKKAGMSNGIAVAGIIFGVINTLIGTIFLVAVVGGILSVAQKCNDLGPGTHFVDGVTYTCS